jgi:uncharacterized protein (DUF4415 family)
MAKPSNLRIEDVGAATARADLNDILISIASLQTTDGAGTGYSGEPTTTYPNMLWYDKATDTLKMRAEADDAWITLGTLNQSLDTFAASIALATQAEAEAGSNNTKAMTPLRVEQAVVDMFNVTGAAPTYACRAWVNFNGTGTVAIRESGNVSSLTDNGTGQYTINFTTAMPDANYCVVLGGARTDNNTNSTGMGFSKAHTRTTSSVQFLTGDSTTGNTDHVIIDVAIFR